MSVERFYPSEAWVDNVTGLVAVKNKAGGWNIYLPTESVSVNGILLRDDPSIANASLDMKMKMMEVKSAEIQNSSRRNPSR